MIHKFVKPTFAWNAKKGVRWNLNINRFLLGISFFLSWLRVLRRIVIENHFKFKCLFKRSKKSRQMVPSCVESERKHRERKWEKERAITGTQPICGCEQYRLKSILYASKDAMRMRRKRCEIKINETDWQSTRDDVRRARTSFIRVISAPIRCHCYYYCCKLLEFSCAMPKMNRWTRGWRWLFNWFQVDSWLCVDIIHGLIFLYTKKNKFRPNNLIWKAMCGFIISNSTVSLVL